MHVMHRMEIVDAVVELRNTSSRPVANSAVFSMNES